MRTSALAWLVAVSPVVACGSSASSPARDRDAGADVGADADVAICTASPKDDASVVVDACGVFVAGTGNDAAPGTKAAPVRTMTKGLELARSANKHLFVCGGAANVFKEAASLSLTPLDTHRGLYGGFACESWTYDETQRPTITVEVDAPVIRVDGARDIRIEDLGLLARNAANADDSSIAVFMSGAQASIRRALVVAGRAREGVAGQDAVPLTAASAATHGNDGVAGGAAIACTCSDGTSTGGAGGTIGISGGAGASGTPTSGSSGGAGAGGTFGAACGAGGDGVAGAAGAAGKAGDHAFKQGEITPTGWVARRGEPGAIGALAQGGGGGTASSGGGGGGGGGCGGCGGAPGQPGHGGGSSIAIAVYESELEVIESSLVASDGGNGGKGGEGQAGQPGGAGGSPSGSSCSGGTGGSGGSGGGGGGGPGGHSVAVLYKGSVPKVDATTSSTAQVGRAGVGGARGGALPPPAPVDRGPAGAAAVLWTSD